MCLRGGTLAGAEALLRWNNAVLGRVPPNRFIPLAEEYGLVNSIGDWVLESVCAQIKQWRDAGLGDVKVSVNLAAGQFANDATVPYVEATLRRFGVPPSCLGLEITEGTVMGDPDKAVAALHRLKDIGVSISLDDFGTGYSSLSYLHNFPLQKVKIDRSFLEGIDTHRPLTLLRGVARLSADLGMSVVVEGIETNEQLELISADGTITEAQGYLFSRPVPAARIRQLLEASHGRRVERDVDTARTSA